MVAQGDPIAARVWFRICSAVVCCVVIPAGAGQTPPASPTPTRPPLSRTRLPPSSAPVPALASTLASASAPADPLALAPDPLAPPDVAPDPDDEPPLVALPEVCAGVPPPSSPGDGLFVESAPAELELLQPAIPGLSANPKASAACFALSRAARRRPGMCTLLAGKGAPSAASPQRIPAYRGLDG